MVKGRGGALLREKVYYIPLGYRGSVSCMVTARMRLTRRSTGVKSRGGALLRKKARHVSLHVGRVF